LVDFLANQSEIAALRAAEAIIGAAQSLSDLAERGRPGPGPAVRELVVPFGRDAYLIQYRIEATTILVARIAHRRERQQR
jgi:plasmid stabilization system protein ParE